MSKVTLLAGILCVFILVAGAWSPVAAQSSDPVATAQAAQATADAQRWRANQAHQGAQAAQATADAAYSEATAQAIEATRAADRQATAHAQQATATAIRATADAAATRLALDVEATRAAIRTRATADAHSHQIEATRTAASIQAQTTQSAAIAEQDRLWLERERAIQPFYTVGPWVIALALGALVGMTLYRLARGEPSPDEMPDLVFYDVEPIIIERPLLPARIERRCVLRPITPGQSRRPVDASTP